MKMKEQARGFLTQVNTWTQEVNKYCNKVALKSPPLALVIGGVVVVATVLGGVRVVVDSLDLVVTWIRTTLHLVLQVVALGIIGIIGYIASQVADAAFRSLYKGKLASTKESAPVVSK